MHSNHTLGQCGQRVGTVRQGIRKYVLYFGLAIVVNKITFKRTWSLSNAVCFKYVKYLTTNTAKVGHVTPSRPPLT